MMKKVSVKDKALFIVTVIALVAIATIGIMLYNEHKVDTFEECAKGKSLLAVRPGKCTGPDGTIYTQNLTPDE